MFFKVNILGKTPWENQYLDDFIIKSGLPSWINGPTEEKYKTRK
jgi:hypothetical protein